mmetsp:Transcript_19469/g.64484  ORF Transcript_19469/g.64484 Transcript_19469/m.64484 type:complete len:101 (-) Transcript_19469:410-712(-)
MRRLAFISLRKVIHHHTSLALSTQQSFMAATEEEVCHRRQRRNIFRSARRESTTMQSPAKTIRGQCSISTARSSREDACQTNQGVITIIVKVRMRLKHSK